MKLSLEHPTYGTRMIAALLSKKLGRAISGKQVQHAYRILEWNVPHMTKCDVLKSASDKIPVTINQSWQTDLTYIHCGIDAGVICSTCLTSCPRTGSLTSWICLRRRRMLSKLCVQAIDENIRHRIQIHRRQHSRAKRVHRSIPQGSQKRE
jgi:hypothetical protein